MLTLFWLVFWVGLAVLAFAAGVSLRVRLNQDVDGAGPVVVTGRFGDGDQPAPRPRQQEG